MVVCLTVIYVSSMIPARVIDPRKTSSPPPPYPPTLPDLLAIFALGIPRKKSRTGPAYSSLEKLLSHAAFFHFSPS